jgi:hypothetical protein
MNTGLVGFVKVAYSCVCNIQLSKLTTMRLPKRWIPRESLYKQVRGFSSDHPLGDSALLFIARRGD